MADSTEQVFVSNPEADAAGVLVAPLGTTLPTDARTALDDGYEAFGLISDDGVSVKTDLNTDTVSAWGGSTAATTQGALAKTVDFTGIEYLNAVAQRTVHGDGNVEVTAATSTTGETMTITHKSGLPPLLQWVVEEVSGPAKVRKVIFKARWTDVADTDSKSDTAEGVGGTLTMFPNEDGEYMKEYTDTGVPTA